MIEAVSILERKIAEKKHLPYIDRYEDFYTQEVEEINQKADLHQQVWGCDNYFYRKLTN
jgi:tRNA U34 5-methylaminomethyl-2-thiouridine-forming methyltransferase MnmC